MKKETLIRILSIVLLALLFFIIGRCSKDCEQVIEKIPVIIPEKEGKFKSPEILTPTNDTTIKTIIKYKDSIKIVDGEVNKELAEKYLALLEKNDKLKAFKEYASAIKINNYETKFDNPDLSLTIKSKTQGTLLEIIPEYKIKEIRTEIPIEIPKPKETVFSTNIGAYTTYNKELNTFDPGIKLDLTNKKGNTLSAGYSLEGNIMVGYSINLFKIKK